MTKTLFARCAPDLVKWLAAEAKRRSTKTCKLTTSDVVRDILEAYRRASTVGLAHGPITEFEQQLFAERKRPETTGQKATTT